MNKKFFYLEFPQGMTLQFMYGTKPIFVSEDTLIKYLLTDHLWTMNLLRNTLNVFELQDGALKERTDIIKEAQETNNLFEEGKLESILNKFSPESINAIISSKAKQEVIEMVLQKEKVDLLGSFSFGSLERWWKLASIAISIRLNSQFKKIASYGG